MINSNHDSVQFYHGEGFIWLWRQTNKKIYLWNCILKQIILIKLQNCYRNFLVWPHKWIFVLKYIVSFSLCISKKIKCFFLTLCILPNIQPTLWTIPPLCRASTLPHRVQVTCSTLVPCHLPQYWLDLALFFSCLAWRGICLYLGWHGFVQVDISCSCV